MLTHSNSSMTTQLVLLMVRFAAQWSSSLQRILKKCPTYVILSSFLNPVFLMIMIAFSCTYFHFTVFPPIPLHCFDPLIHRLLICNTYVEAELTHLYCVTIHCALLYYGSLCIVWFVFFCNHVSSITSIMSSTYMSTFDLIFVAYLSVLDLI